MTFTALYMSDKNYARLMIESVHRTRRLYPGVRIRIYDWGLTDRQRAEIASMEGLVDVVDWTGAIASLKPDVPDDPGVQIQIARQDNARVPCLRRKLNKFLIRKVPNSNWARRVVERAFLFEAKLKAKADCFLDASRYCGSEKIIALDAGAYIIRPINELPAQTGNVVA